ncbi:V-set domain containing T-cell activation inhibitor 1 [Lates calcarifer]|uniref:V-set domain containing T-cell activation inhibitor 1 n=1 Tax=Lates calcarifer TaxID=8187 RepID=A0AAJ8AZC4_LATCA|nr:V-set domain containing T-cell activation inhibitor 1 [Lates calcarifer]
MAANEALLLCSLLWIVSSAEGKEFTVTCLASEDCTLPCQFQSDGRGARIMWYKKKTIVSCTRYGNTSFVVGHNSPADKYKGRTGLYADQVLEGNATLLLRNVTPNDQGKYFCITMTAPRTDESGIISLVIKAPVREIDIDFSGDVVTCAAEGIFPAPTLTWSTDPPADAQLLQNKTKAQKNKYGFYDIQSSLRLTGNITTNHTYVCSITSDSNRKTAFLKASVLASAGSSVKISCSLPRTVPQSFNVTWRFRRSHPIVSISVVDQRSQAKVWDQWKPRVITNFSASGGLHLHSLKSEHQGAYTCEVNTPEEMYVTWTDVTVTEESKTFTYIMVIAGLSYFLFLSYVTLGILGYRIRQLESARRQEEQTDGTSVSLTEAVNSEVTEE